MPVIKFQPSRPTSLLAGLSTTLVEKITSSASNGTPSDQRTPLRKCHVIVLPSLLMPPFAWVGTTVTSSGYIRLCSSYLTRYAWVICEIYPSVVSVNRCGLSVVMSPDPSARRNTCVRGPRGSPLAPGDCAFCVALVHEQRIAVTATAAKMREAP